MGLFDVQGHAASRPTFQLGSPLFDKVTIELNPEYYETEKLIIEVENNSDENLYIQSAELDGRSLETSWFYRDDLINGGRLKLEMGAAANENWGITNPPPSMSTE
jgi:putative alpha-1,2-mannosidase